MSFPFYKQYDAMDCGPTCLRIIAKYYGRSFSLQYLRQKCHIQRTGVSLLGISEAAESIGLRTLAVRIDYQTLLKEAILPCIIHWKQNHFIVVFKINNTNVWVADPAKSIRKISRKEFEKQWMFQKTTSGELGVVLLLEPSASFLKDENSVSKDKVDASHLISHIKKQRKLFSQLILGIMIGLILQIILPFLTQSVVDVGIAGKDINFIALVLIAQIMIFLGSTIVEFIRGWIMLYISTRINIGLLTEFFIKLMRLPMSYFDVKHTGDIMQRMGDHGRIQTFFTNTLLSTSFSLVTFIVFTFLAVAYDVKLFIVFLSGSILYFGWILLFLKPRRDIDFQKFDLSASNQNITIEMIQGMQEIKLNNCEKQKRWSWERTQAQLFKLSIKSLFVNQIQSAGALFINQGKNVLVSFLSAKAVIDGTLTLGEMMAVQYVIGQLNGPVQQIVMFIQSLQDTKISLGRINEIQEMENEEQSNQMLLKTLPICKSLSIDSLNYKYPGYDNAFVLNDINLDIPEGKITAIVGISGSGKTTLLKLLLKYYNIEEGTIKVGGINIKSISPSTWRSKCGVVMQDSFIFSDTIAANIAVGEDYPDQTRLIHAIAVANITELIESLPLGINTKIGIQGSGISQGEKQRILIARAVYKDPEYIFFDEATNSLDANNEGTIMRNLNDFFKGKTVVIVAHRLSTVKHADNIVVLDRGKITESGTHAQLANLKGTYYQLVKNQLELGN